MPVDALRKSPTMSHLLDGLESGKDIGHYGRLTVAMVGHHYMDRDELADLLMKGKGAEEREVKSLVLQAEERNYNPPSRQRLQEWQTQQEFPLMPDPADPTSGNLYRELDMPEEVIESIEEYREQQFDAQEG